jgi:hypothetical protein
VPLLAKVTGVIPIYNLSKLRQPRKNDVLSEQLLCSDLAEYRIAQDAAGLTRSLAYSCQTGYRAYPRPDHDEKQAHLGRRNYGNDGLMALQISGFCCA